MKTIIAGGRDYSFEKRDIDYLDDMLTRLPITEVICGMARGADTGGLVWATTCALKVSKFPADWNLYGRSAGPRRNEQMAKYGEVLIAFSGGTGTSNMVMQMKRLGKPVYKPFW